MSDPVTARPNGDNPVHHCLVMRQSSSGSANAQVIDKGEFWKFTDGIKFTFDVDLRKRASCSLTGAERYFIMMPL